MGPMRLRLYHHSDGARVAYRETGAGPPLALLHSLGLSHREWEPIVSALAPRFRVVLPDLPLHGDSEWTMLNFTFDVSEPTREVVLVCELKGNRGEAWFDTSSLKIRRVE